MNIRAIRSESDVPQYQTPGAAAMDLVASIEESVTLEPGAQCIIPTGIAIELPESYEAQVRARSGHAAKHGIGLVNGIGTIDSDYRGEIGVILINWGKQPFVIEPGMRIAQMVIAKYERVELQLTDELGVTDRGEGKFGSTL